MPATRSASGRIRICAVLGLVVAGWLLAGCGEAENPYSLPEYDATAASGALAATGSAPAPTVTAVTPTTTPSPQVKFTPADALGQGAWAEKGRSVATTKPQKAVVRAVVKYVSVRVRLSNTWQVDDEALAAVAAGEAVTSARERAERQREADRRSIGRFVVNVSSVRVDGDHATVTGCHFDATSEVDAAGNVLVAPPGGVLITMQLQRTGTTWRVLDWPESAPSCDWRE